MTDHYEDALHQLIRQGLLNCEQRILVGCGGKRDRDILLKTGFKNVTISNLDVRVKGSEFAPFAWSFQDVENLAFKDGDFDFCIVHDGLHHCQSPHRGLLELYRVAKKGVLAFEPRDTLLSRIGVRLNFGQEYEVGAVFDNGNRFGGVKNTSVPNYVYRWTEREIEKTIASSAPWGRHQFIYFYRTRIPWGRLRLLKNKLWLAGMIVALPALKLFTWVFPRQSNTFGFAILKPSDEQDLHPWLKRLNGEIIPNIDWLSKRYQKLPGAIISGRRQNPVGACSPST
jgi:SAM-dependent methyltransferase